MRTSGIRRRPDGGFAAAIVDRQPAVTGPPDAARRLRLVAGIGLGLLFLTGPLADLGHSSLGPGRLAAVAAALVVFVVAYVLLVRPVRGSSAAAPARVLALLALMLGLAVAARTIGAPSSFDLLFVFFAVGAGMRLRLRPAITVIVATSAGLVVEGAIRGDGSSSYGAKALTVLAIGSMMLAFGRQIRINAALAAAREEIGRLAVAEERLRIARDLHDLLGHSLSTIALKSELAARLVDVEPARAAAEISDVQDVSRQALAEVREAVQGWRQLALDDALAGARAALSAAGIDYALDAPPPRLPAEVEEVFAWAVREGTTNVVRHSRARRCAVRIHGGAGEAVVEVEDDGVSAPPDPDAGSGLSGLAERAAAVRGRLEAGAAPGGGFLLRLVVPLPS
ncbi:MAG: sensor histidine kinase [Gaiellaceae bacterium]